MENREAKKHIKKIETILLEGEHVAAYLKMLIRLINGARINKFYPDQQKVVNLLSFLIPENNFNFYDTLEINRNSGFPVEKEISRVIVDRQIAPKTMREDSEQELIEKFRKNPIPVNDRRLRRYHYHKNLMNVQIPEMFNLELKLRMVDTEKYIAFFNNIIDRYDPDSSLFARYTMVIGQEDSKWGKSSVLVDGDQLKFTKNFRYLTSKYAIDEAEFAFILLNDLEHVVVEEVQRCRIGPLYFNGLNIPQGMEEIFEKHPGAFILSLPMDRASLLIKEDVNNDPLSPMYRDILEPGARELRDKKAEMIGYHIYKERKFVCSRDVVKDFSKFLADRNARCVIRGV